RSHRRELPEELGELQRLVAHQLLVVAALAAVPVLTVLGVAVLVALLGSPESLDELVSAHQRGWAMIVVLSLATAAIGLAQPKAGPGRAPGGAQVPASSATTGAKSSTTS
ncbi:MAG: hypothetical protein AAFO29_16390, partial [Actinomycetota bacterium]